MRRKKTIRPSAKRGVGARVAFRNIGPALIDAVRILVDDRLDIPVPPQDMLQGEQGDTNLGFIARFGRRATNVRDSRP